MEQQATSTPGTVVTGSRDGIGAGDHDEPYRFGLRPTVDSTYPFNSKQFARLLVLRGRAQDGEFDDDRTRA